LGAISPSFLIHFHISKSKVLSSPTTFVVKFLPLKAV
jgi:hypothetical protein